MNSAFDEQYYRDCFGRPYGRDDSWLAFFQPIADCITTEIGARRVLDAGCALGLLVELLHQRNVDVDGFDVSPYAIASVHETVRDRCRIGSVNDEIEGWYDLIVCIEVFAHVPPPDDEKAIANFCRHTDDVLFSATTAAPGDPRHVNLNPPEHFAEIFARHGFYRDHAFDASFIQPSTVRYRRQTPPPPDLIRHYERRLREGHELERQLRAAHDTLAHAQSTILHMQQSRFWKARKPWAWLTGR